MSKTYSPTHSNIARSWLLVDLEDKILGRASAKIAHYLRGKHKAEFAPHVDCGDYIIVINAEKVKVTGNKDLKKIYYSHSGYPGALSQKKLRDLRKTKPEEIVIKAVSGMIPDNKLKQHVLAKLKVFAGPKHPHESQKPTELKV